MDRVRGIRDRFTAGVVSRLESAGVQVVHGEAAFNKDAHSVVAAGVVVEAPLVVINTGTNPLLPEIAGLAGVPLLTNLNLFELTALPRRLVVLGGGYIGLEFGQGMARLGSEVHVVHRGAWLLNSEESEVGDVLAEAFFRDGIAVHLDTQVREVQYTDGVYRLTLSSGEVLEAEGVIVATGRRPNTEMLNAPAAGIALDGKGYVQIDAQFRTSAPGVYAIGDVAKQPAFTHVSWEDYRRLIDILDGGSRTRDDRVLGYAVYTEPQVGRVGLTLAQAEAQGLRVRAVTLPMGQIARAIEWGHDLGFYRLVVEEGSERILGATLVGYEAGELVHVLLAHMQAGSTWRVLEQSVHIHPTYGESLPSLARLLV
jgi:dihydrolipoamide dehydrogenase